MSDKKSRILDHLRAYPPELRERRATIDEVREYEAEFGPLPDEVRWFLVEAGGGVVGREHLDGIENLPESQRKYVSEFGPDGWSMTNVVIVGWDGWGNPIAVDRASGRVLVEDHNFGGIHEEASSFQEYLEHLLARRGA